MNQRVLIAQASGTPIPTPTTPKVVVVVKPGSEQAITLDLGFDQSTKLDLSAVANEKMTLVHAGTKLIILFDNQSTVTISPFFDSSGKPLTSFDVDLGSGRDLSGDQFAATFPITDDQSVLPAAGNGGGPSSGADFHDTAVDPLSTGTPLPLLGTETLGTFAVTGDLPPQTFQDFKPSVIGAFGTAVVLEADLDLNKDVPGTVGDLSQGYTVGTDAVGRGESIAVKGVTFSAGTQAIDVTFGDTTGVTVTDGAGNPITVFWVSSQGGTHLEGFLSDPTTPGSHHPAIVIEIVDTTDGTHATHADANGTVSPVVTVTLTDQFPHSDTSHTGTADLITITGITVVATDGTGDVASAPLPIQIADDAPVADSATAPVTLDDDAQTLFVGNSGGTDDVDNATSVIGVAGTLFVAGADNFKSLAFTPPEGIKAIYQTADGFAAQELLNYATTLNGDHTILTATGVTTGNVVFTLDVGPDGSYSFAVSKPLVQNAVGVSEENLGVVVGFTVTDGDGDHSAGSLTVNVNDDTPTAHVVLATPVLDDDAQALFAGNSGGIDDVDNATFVTGSAGTLFTAGADGLKSIAFADPSGLKAIYKLTSGLAAQEALHYTTDTHATNASVAAGHTIYTAIGDTSGNVVFTLDVAPDGSYRFTQSEPLVHPTAGTSEENLDVTVAFTVTDGDSDTSSGSLTVSVNDDTPVAKVVTAATTLDDDAQTLFAGNPGGVGDVDNAKSVSDIAGSLFSAGADGLKSVGFTPPSGLKAIYKDSHTGLAQQETLSYTTTTDSSGHTILTATGDQSHHTVFTLSVGADGSYTFNLNEPLVQTAHDTTQTGQAIEETQGVTIGFTVTDGDNDTSAGSLTINVNDDAPVIQSVEGANKVITLTDNENDIFTLWSQGSSPNDGGADGSQTELFTGAAVVSGSLSTIVSAGADGLKSYGFISDQAAINYFQSLQLYSKQTALPENGVLLTYTVTHIGDLVILTANEPGTLAFGLGGNPVFSFTLNSQSGDFTFRLFDELIHVAPGTPDANSDYDLRSGPVVDGVQKFISALDFGHIIQVTDGDGDTITLDKSVLIKIHDDAPVADIDLRSETVTIDETANLQKDDTNSSSVASLFTTVANKGDDPDVNGTGAINFARSDRPVVINDSILGADQPALGQHFTLAIHDATNPDSGLTLTDGSTIHLSIDSSGRIIGVVDSGTFADQTAFAVAIDDNGYISVAQYLSLHNPTPGSSHDETVNLGGKIDAVLTVTDSDGDVSSDSVGVGANIRFADDGPTAAIAASGNALVIDESAGDQTGTNDILGTANTPIPAEFSGLGTPIEIAQSQSAVTATGSVYGADGQGAAAPVFALTLSSSNGVNSGLDATDGRSIFLFKEGNIVVGREGTLGDVADANGSVVFAVSLDSATGTLTVAEYIAIHHPVTTDPNDALSLGSNIIRASVTITDGDGDTSVASVGIGNQITFLDDGPTVAAAPLNQILNGTFMDGVWSAPVWWGSSSTDVPNWTIGQSPVEPGTTELGRSPDGYLGMHSSTGGYMVDLGSSPGDITLTQSFLPNQLIAGQTYAIQFEAGAPFPETAKLQVLWDGQVIGTIDPSGPGNLTSYNYIVTANGTAGDVLTFREIGTGDAPVPGTWEGNGLLTEGYHGTYIANVGLVATYVVDEDGLAKGNQDLPTPSEGDAPGLATSVMGALGINWGADNYDSAVADTLVSGHFVQDNNGTTLIGRNVVFTDNSVGVSGASGLTSNGDIITVTPSDFGTRLIGTATHDGVVRIVFEVSLSDDGSGKFNFVLKDNLDHAPNGSENDIDLTFKYTATDSDGDSVQSTFTVGVDDDTPIFSSKADSVTINESLLPGGTGVGSHGEQIAFGALHIRWGADNGDARHIVFTKDDHGNFIAPVLTSKGVALEYVSSYDSSGSQLLVAYRQGDAHTDDNAVLAVALFTGESDDPAGGYYQINLLQPLDQGSQGADTAKLTFGITAYDSDGDGVQTTFDVNIVDDIPTPAIASTGTMLIIDETAGDQLLTNDVLGATNAPIPAVFASIPGAPIEIAQSAAAIVSYSGTYGADNPGATAPAISLGVLSAGVWSGLSATDGQKIFLYQEGDLIIGREGVGAAGGVADAGGSIAFAISIDSATGIATIAEYTAIHHNDPLDSNESATPLTIAAGVLLASVTFTDGDGDHVTSTPVSIGGQIQFLDDGPSITAPADLIVNGSFELGHSDLQNAQWSVYHSLPGWTSVNQSIIGNVPFEIQTDNAGGVAAQEGHAFVELDSDLTSGNLSGGDHFNATSHTNAIIQQTVTTQVGETYELTFWYAARPGEGGQNSGGMDVLWNNTSVQAIASDGMVEGQWQQYHVFVVGTGADTVGFQGLGHEDSLGALLDNVSLIPMAVVDEDGLSKALHGDAVTGNNDSQPGDAVVPNNDGDGNEATATGLLAINWGADNFNGGTDGYSAANGFTQDGSGRSVTFTNKTVGITGGTLTSHGDIITFDWSSDHTKLIGTATHSGNDSRTVIEVTLSDDGTGAFHVILYDALDHTAGGSENDIVLSFNYTATDSDGDFVTGAFNVLVDDDVPVFTGNVVAAGVVNEADMFVLKTVSAHTLDFSSTGLSATHLHAGGGTGIAVVSSAGNSNLQGPDQNPGATTLVFTADSGTTFTLGSISLGLFGANSGSPNIVLNGYDATGHLIATATFAGQDVGGNPAAVISNTFNGAADSQFGSAQISRLEIIPPSSLAGRVVIDNFQVTETTITTTNTPHTVETVVDLTSLVSVGADSPGTWTLTQFTQQPVSFTQGSAVGPATYGGVPITMTSDGHTITGVAGAVTIFTLILSADGHATFDLFKPIDGGTLRSLDFSQFVTVTDSDGDKLTLPAGDLLININSVDHAPAVSAASISVDESGLPAHNGLSAGTGLPQGASATHAGTIAVDLGDGPSTVTINGTAVTTVGQTFDGLSHFGTLTITSITATSVGYSYTLTTNTSGDVTHDDFNIVVKDDDNQTVSTTLTVNIVDDAPVAQLDNGNVNEGAKLTVLTASGVLSNDAQGADGASIVGVRAAGGDTTTAVTNALVAVDITGQHGTLNLHADGSYTYQSLANNVSANTFDTFVYTIKDGDGDLSTTTLNINIADVTIVAANSTAIVNEAALDTIKTGQDLAVSTVTGTLGTTSAAETDASQHVSAIGGIGGLTYALATGGNAVTSGAYGSIQVNANGTYVYTLTSPVHESTANNGTDTVSAADHFTYIATDANGNSSTGTINIDIKDDAPTATNVTASMGENDTTTVTLHQGTDFVYGADGAAAAGALTLGTVSVTGDYIPASLAGLDISLNGTDIVIKPGTTFDPLNNGQHSAIHIQYSVTDGDGDVTTNELTVTVNGANDGAVIAGSAAGSVTEDGQLTANGSLTVNDVDVGQNHFQSVAPASLVGTYGSFTFDSASGAWTYSLNNSSSVVQALNTGDTKHDTLIVNSADWTANQTITVDIHGTDDSSPPITTTNDNPYYAFLNTAYGNSQGQPVSINFDADNIFNGGSDHFSYTFTNVFGSSTGLVITAGDGTVTGVPQEGLNVFRIDAYDTTAHDWSFTYVAFSGVGTSGSGTSSYANLTTSENYPATYLDNVVHIDATSTIPFATTVSGFSGNDVVIGNDNANTLVAASGNDALYGLGGNDSLNGGGNTSFLSGGAGDDTLTLGSSAGYALGGAGNDTLNGSGNNDVLIGGDGNDILKGNQGNDILYGGAGNDTLTGGSNSDTFVFSEYGAANKDTITDFNQSSGGAYNTTENDKIDLSGMFDSIFGGASTASATDYVRIVKVSGTETLQIDLTGGGAAHDNHIWQDVATMTGVSTGNVVNIILDHAQAHQASIIAGA